jgi:hypothetical protein
MIGQIQFACACLSAEPSLVQAFDEGANSCLERAVSEQILALSRLC